MEVYIMGRPKGKTSGYTIRSANEKLKLIKPILDGLKSSEQIGRETGISSGLLIKWTHLYQEGGIKALENKRKPGNPLQKYQAKKNLLYTEQLEYENMKLRIENERLKKGYILKEADLKEQKK